MNESFSGWRKAFNIWGLSVLAMSSTVALAQVEPESSALTLTYRSAWAKYQGYADQPVASWQQSNEAVKAAGGWRAYAKEAQQPDAPGKTEKATETRHETNQTGSRP